MKILLNALFLFVINEIRCGSVNDTADYQEIKNIIEIPSTSFLRGFMIKSEKENGVIFEQFRILQRQHKFYIENYYEPSEISLSIDIPDTVRWAGETTKLYFTDVKVWQKKYNLYQTVTNFVVRSFDQYYKIGIQLKEQSVKIIGSVTIDQNGTNETVTFTIPVTFNAVVPFFCELSRSNHTKLKKAHQLFSIPINEPLQTEPRSYEYNETLVRNLRELEFIALNYVLIEIEEALKAEIYQKQIYSLLPPLTERQLDAEPETLNQQYVVIDNRHNFNVIIALNGLSNFNNVTLDAKGYKIFLNDLKHKFPANVEYSTIFTIRNITGKGYWSYESYELEMPRGEFSLSTDYIRIKMRNHRPAYGVPNEETYETKIAPVTINVDWKQHPVQQYERDFVKHFLSTQIEDIISTSLRNSLRKSGVRRQS